MRKTLAVCCATAALALGGAGVANATVDQAPSSTTTTLADDNGNSNNQHSDNSGLWGLTGLLGLAGLAGLARRRTDNAAVHPAGARGPGV